MTRMELVQLVLAQARSNGFQFRRWYVGWLGLPWEGAQKAAEILSDGRRYYSLLFSRDFAQNFWKSGGEIDAADAGPDVSAPDGQRDDRNGGAETLYPATDPPRRMAVPSSPDGRG